MDSEWEVGGKLKRGSKKAILFKQYKKPEMFPETLPFLRAAAYFLPMDEFDMGSISAVQATAAVNSHKSPGMSFSY